jgi:hypothetical protein
LNNLTTLQELIHLRTLWTQRAKSEIDGKSETKIKRSTTLIVPKVTYQGTQGSLNNDHWFFCVPYAFRDALDIKYEQRMLNKDPYMVWTQGPILRFKEGDTLIAKEGGRVVQVEFANRMGWDSEANTMYEGVVTYSEFYRSDTDTKKVKSVSCSQMNFLELLVLGSYAA